MANTPRAIIVHHTAASSPIPQFDAINDWHKARAFPRSSLGYFVGYHYVIEQDGTIRTARRTTDEGAHTIGQNTSSIGICLVGNFDTQKPTAQQEAALTSLLLTFTREYGIDANAIHPHRRYKATSCYGKKLPDNWARSLYVNARIAELTRQIDALRAQMKEK